MHQIVLTLLQIPKHVFEIAFSLSDKVLLQKKTFMAKIKRDQVDPIGCFGCIFSSGSNHV